jgi:hypothetical protein
MTKLSIGVIAVSRVRTGERGCEIRFDFSLEMPL